MISGRAGPEEEEGRYGNENPMYPIWKENENCNG